jgi:hypothetical protein
MRCRRLRSFQPSRVHLNTLIAPAGADNGYAAPIALKGAIESRAGNMVGSGIKPPTPIMDR